VGAVLTQNTAWPNVEKAIRALKEKGDLSLGFLLSLPHETMAELIRPCGYFRIKARRLKNLLALAQEKGKGDVEAFLSLPTDELRKALLSVSGIGPETADSILLYAAKRPVFMDGFPVKPSTKRYRPFSWSGSPKIPPFTTSTTRYLWPWGKGTAGRNPSASVAPSRIYFPMNFDPVTIPGYLAPVVMGEAWESPSRDKNPSQPKR
jgi:hypothetical protein